jgi:hypothetical protein
VIEHVLADAPVGDGPAAAPGPRVLALVVVEIVACGAGLVL